MTIIYRSQRPLFPKDNDDITNEVKLRYEVDANAYWVIEQDDPWLEWMIYADNAEPKSGRRKMRDLQDF